MKKDTFTRGEVQTALRHAIHRATVMRPGEEADDSDFLHGAWAVVELFSETLYYKDARQPSEHETRRVER